MDIDVDIPNKHIRKTTLAMRKGNYLTFIECRLDLSYLPVDSHCSSLYFMREELLPSHFMKCIMTWLDLFQEYKIVSYLNYPIVKTEQGEYHAVSISVL